MTHANEVKSLILHAISSVPCGRVASYGAIAKMSGAPKHARYVASVLKQLPPDTELPWHRIIKSDGRIAFAHDSKQYKKQKALLEREGIACPAGKVDLRKFGL